MIDLVAVPSPLGWRNGSAAFQQCYPQKLWENDVLISHAWGQIDLAVGGDVDIPGGVWLTGRHHAVARFGMLRASEHNGSSPTLEPVLQQIGVAFDEPRGALS
ncbi:hypothetical protein ACGTN6_16185 [Halomonas sp. THAF12]|uniref:hypothetical protein n=1 Tax=Halomonas sp. B23F22_10 TaxID=3459515 RepID=UPI00373EB414